MALGRTYGMLLSLIFCAAGVRGVCQAAPKPATPPAPNANSKNAAPVKRVRVISDLSAFHLEQQPEHVKSIANQITAGTRGGRKDLLVLCAPSLGTALTTHPLFEWKDAAGASRATFTLLSESGDVLYEGEVVGSSWKYPDTAAALEPGQSYRWKIAGGGGMDGLPDPATFQVLDQAAGKAIAQQLDSMAATADPLARAQVFLEAGLWYDTVASLKSAIRQNPNRKDLAEQLHVLYEHVAPACEDTAGR